MIVAIYAYDNLYGGMHGIHTTEVIEVNSIQEAREYAMETSIDVINTYQEIMDDFYSQAEDEGLEEGTEEYDEFITECIYEDAAYELYKVTDVYDTIEKMNDDFYNNTEGFIKEHCGDLLI